ncbi:(E3-independent) E2 ubiquitin-conjugating enzyme-like [Littorina saxatilis]|uniref:UBC core domain-containing protein n=1 Tax=Littorina saxatilis TaxID=31220 RepID=A0AAN9BXT3_9CAEN
MAACSLFEEDEVCHVTPDNTYVYGLVMENSETVSSEEEDSRHDVCKKGCVRVAWHPKGKESLDTPENKVLLADRSLMVADIVRKFVPGQETQCGSVQDMQVTCHLHITGTDKYVYNVDSKLLSSCVQLQKFDNGYVTMDNWLGRVEEVTETITLQLPDGAQCQVDDSDVCYLDDITEKRPETATFNEEYWYPGQQLKGILGNLCNANWLQTSLLHNSKNVDCKRNSTFYSVVEKVEIRSIFVYWICRGFSKASISPGNKLLPPPREVKGADIERLQLVDWFEHCTVKLGDKMYYTVREEDVLETQLPKHRCAPNCVQQASEQRLAEVTHRTEDLYHQRFDESNKHRRRGSKKGVTSSASASSSSATATTTSASTASVATTPDNTAIATETPEHEVLPRPDVGAGDVEAGADADDEYEDIDEGKDAGSGSDAGSVSSSASGAKRRKRDKGVGMSIKSLRNASRHARRPRPVAEIKTAPGSRVATEVCYTFSRIKVMWQDGSVEEKVPSVELFPVHHMDELEFFPGTFVIDAAAPDTSNEYGVVTSCNHFERTCQVKWYKPYELGQTSCPVDVIKESEVSVYDIHDHPDYKFRPGHSVIRVAGFEDTIQTLQAVGQVIRTDPTGTVFVHWSDETFTSSYPQDLYIVWDLSDYSNSDWESEDSTSSEEDSETDASWETEEEEEDGWKVDGGGDGTQSEEEEWDSLKNMNEKRRNEIKNLMSKVQNFFGVLNDFYMTLSVASPDTVQKPTPMDSTLMECLKKVLKMYRSCRKLDKILKTGFFSAPPVLNLVASIKFDMKKERSNKIKQHLEHVFESNNKGLLDRSKSHVVKTETGTSTQDLSNATVDQVRLGSPGVAAAAFGSPSKKIKTEDVGTCVDDVGSSVDLVSGDCASAPVENGIAPGVLDVERDISSRLAAANVDEKKDTVYKDAATSAPPVGDLEPVKLHHCDTEAGMDADNIVRDSSAVDIDSCRHSSSVDLEEKKDSSATDAQQNKDSSAGATESADVAKIVQLCELFETTLASIHESVDKINEAMKGSRRNSTTTATHAAEVIEVVKAEEDKEKHNVEAPEPPPCPGVKTENGGEGVGVLPPDADVDMRADNQDACDTPNNSSANSPHLNGKEEEEEEEADIVDPPGVVLPTGFFMCSSAPDCHSYIAKTCLPSNPKTFQSALRKELKLLKSSLPDGIIIKGFEDRMDLFSVLIDGPSDTPYEDGVFLFDIMLPHDYPINPPLFHYLSYCSDRLNPNLYADGKVCVSLLGTWSGKGMEVWTQNSNLLQVLVSIQGLILVDEPYYNEAGYEKQRGQQIAFENSRVYNEMAMLKLVESMTAICSDLPRPFEEEVREHLKNKGPNMIERLRSWLKLSEGMGDRQSLVTKGKTAEGGTATPPSTSMTSVITATPTPTASNVESIESAQNTVHAETNGATGLSENGGTGLSESGATGLSDNGVTGLSESGASNLSENGATGLSENSSACAGRALPPQGKPHFPLLPMSKGFRLTLHKSLTCFQTALHKIQQGAAASQNSMEMDPAESMDPPCENPTTVMSS